MSDKPAEAPGSNTMGQTAVFAVKSFVDKEVIDGGDTVVLRFKTPDDREVVLLVPQRVIANLRDCLGRTEQTRS